jgi:hypothetical protein
MTGRMKKLFINRQKGRKMPFAQYLLAAIAADGDNYVKIFKKGS